MQTLSETCPNCGGRGYKKRGKLYCVICDTIIETCCEGATCDEQVGNNSVGCSNSSTRISDLVKLINRAIQEKNHEEFRRLDEEHRNLCNERNAREVKQRTSRPAPREDWPYLEGYTGRQLRHSAAQLKKRCASWQHEVKGLNKKLTPLKRKLDILNKTIERHSRKLQYVTQLLSEEAARATDNTQGEGAPLQSASIGGQMPRVPVVRRPESTPPLHTSTGRESKAKLFGNTCRITWTG